MNASIMKILICGLFVCGIFSAGDVHSETLEVLPGKLPLIKKSFRPVNFESTVEQLDQDYTPNNAFFVRSHSPNLPKVDLKKWKLVVEGESVENQLSLTFQQLTHDFTQVELSALLLCSGNRRGRFEPRVQGVQWNEGAVGNAKWRGVRLKDVLQKAGIKSDAVEVVFNGSDFPNVSATPDFEKSLPLSKALDENTIIAFKMNGADIPELNGYPARLIVPGWTATYWIKHLSSIRIVSKPYDGFWMKKAYRIPKGKFKDVETPWTGQETEQNVPVTEIVVNSQITFPRDGEQLKKNKNFLTIRGYAWDSGKGIQTVHISMDNGKTWQEAELGKDLGKFAWRPFKAEVKIDKDGSYSVMSRATNVMGQTQSMELIHNPPGYHNNVPRPILFTVGVQGKDRVVELKSAKPAKASESLELVDAPGRELVMANCMICHSVEYIPMNAGFLDEKGWTAVVQKMQKVMGAPIHDEDVPKVVNYLSQHYGLTPKKSKSSSAVDSSGS